MRWVSVVALLLVPGLLAAQTSSSSKPVQLAWKFKEGEKFWVDTQTRIEQTERTANAGIANVVQVRTIMSYIVRKVTEQNHVELEAKIEQTRYNNNQTPDSEKMSTLYGRLQGATFRVVLGPDRQVQKLEGYAEWLQKLGVIFNPTEVDRVRTLIPESDIKNALTEGFGFLPDFQITPGQQWRKKSELNMAPAGVLGVNLTYTYRGSDRGREKITIESKEPGKFTMSAVGMTPGAQAAFSLDQRTGTILFNNQTGKLEQAEHFYQTKGTVVVPGNDAAASGRAEILHKIGVKQTLTSKPPTR